MADLPQPAGEAQAKPGRRPLSRWRKLVLGLIPATVLFGGTELVLRLLGVPEAKYLAERFEFPPKSKFGRGYVRDPATFWRLRHGYNEIWGSYKVAYSHEWMGGTVSKAEKARRGESFPDKQYYSSVRWQVNARGQRGAEPRPGRKIVLFLGSSVTFGWGVKHQDCFVGLLRRRLYRSGEEWDVVNAGVPNYSAYQSLATLRRLIDRLQPRVIVFESGINGGLPSSGARDSEFAMADRGVVPSRVMRSSNTLLALQQLFRGRQLTKTPALQPGQKKFFRTRLYDPQKCRVTEAEFRQNLRTVVELGQGVGAKVLFLFPGLYNEYGKRRLRKAVNLADPREIDMCAALQAVVEGDDYLPFFIPYDEAHLSRRGHQHVAEAIWARFQRDQTLRR